MAANVPNDPIISFAMSRPATFFTTIPPELTSFPSSVANFMPMITSRAVPYKRRRGPLVFAATTPPTVAEPANGGSSGNHLIIARKQ